MILQEVKNNLPLFTTILLTLVTGYCLGRMVDLQLTARSVPSLNVHKTVPKTVPVVRIDGIENGLVAGSIQGPVRLQIGDQFVQRNTDGSFSTEPGPLLVNNVHIIVPAGMHYVASKRGKKYYSVESSSVRNITPENRVYFSSQQAAKLAGYQN